MRSTDTYYCLMNEKGGVLQSSEEGRTILNWTFDLNEAQLFSDRRQLVNYQNIHRNSRLAIREVQVTRDVVGSV